MMTAMLQKTEGVHVGFLGQVTGMKVWRLGEKTWKNDGVDRVIQATGTKHLREYINKRQVAVAEWVALHQTFEVYAK